MSMSDDEVIERILYMGVGRSGLENENSCIAKALREIQQYRAIGTVSEFRELKEKATAKKAIVSRSKHEAYCPNCKSVVADDEFWALDEYVHHCECGQAILGTDWSEGKE